MFATMLSLFPGFCLNAFHQNRLYETNLMVAPLLLGAGTEPPVPAQALQVFIQFFLMWSLLAQKPLLL